MTPDKFIAALTASARACAESTGVPASITIAQGALESRWGESALYVQANNLFGVKADSSWRGPTIDMPTRECIGGKWQTATATWRRYPDLAACIADHARFLRDNPRYRRCFVCTDYRCWATGLQSAGYATDPQYAAKLISIIDSHGLGKLDL